MSFCVFLVVWQWWFPAGLCRAPQIHPTQWFCRWVAVLCRPGEQQVAQVGLFVCGFSCLDECIEVREGKETVTVCITFFQYFNPNYVNIFICRSVCTYTTISVGCSAILTHAVSGPIWACANFTEGPWWEPTQAWTPVLGDIKHSKVIIFSTVSFLSVMFSVCVCASQEPVCWCPHWALWWEHRLETELWWVSQLPEAWLQSTREEWAIICTCWHYVTHHYQLHTSRPSIVYGCTYISLVRQSWFPENCTSETQIATLLKNSLRQSQSSVVTTSVCSVICQYIWDKVDRKQKHCFVTEKTFTAEHWTPELHHSQGHTHKILF